MTQSLTVNPGTSRLTVLPCFSERYSAQTLTNRQNRIFEISRSTSTPQLDFFKYILMASGTGCNPQSFLLMVRVLQSTVFPASSANVNPQCIRFLVWISVCSLPGFWSGLQSAVFQALGAVCNPVFQAFGAVCNPQSSRLQKRITVCNLPGLWNGLQSTLFPLPIPLAETLMWWWWWPFLL